MMEKNSQTSQPSEAEHSRVTQYKHTGFSSTENILMFHFSLSYSEELKAQGWSSPTGWQHVAIFNKKEVSVAMV